MDSYNTGNDPGFAHCYWEVICANSAAPECGVEGLAALDFGLTKSHRVVADLKVVSDTLGSSGYRANSGKGYHHQNDYPSPHEVMY
jgi:hypothetical protein